MNTSFFEKLMGNIPVELFEFEYNGDIYRQTSSIKDFTDENSNIFTSKNIKRSNLQLTSDENKSRITVTIDLFNEIADIFDNDVPLDIMTIKLYRTYKTSTDKIVLFSGVVSSFIVREDRIELTCDNLIAYTDKTIMRLTYQSNCNHNVFDDKCSLNKDLYKNTGTITDIINDSQLVIELNENNLSTELLNIKNSLSILDFVDLHKSGFIEINGERRYVINANSASATAPLYKINIKYLSKFNFDLNIGDNITIFTGCKRTVNNCNIYNNFDNYFGFNILPNKNIFESGV